MCSISRPVPHLQEPGGLCQLPHGPRQHLPLQSQAQEASPPALRRPRPLTAPGPPDADGQRARPVWGQGKRLWQHTGASSLHRGLWDEPVATDTTTAQTFTPVWLGGLTGRWSPRGAAPASASNPVSGRPRLVLREKGSGRPLAAGPGALARPARAPRVTHVGGLCAGRSPGAGTATRGADRCRCRGRRPPAAAAPLL